MWKRTISTNKSPKISSLTGKTSDSDESERLEIKYASWLRHSLTHDVMTLGLK